MIINTRKEISKQADSQPVKFTEKGEENTNEYRLISDTRDQ
jgi:hypothetical protein